MELDKAAQDARKRDVVGGWLYGLAIVFFLAGGPVFLLVGRIGVLPTGLGCLLLAAASIRLILRIGHQAADQAPRPRSHS